MKTLLFLFMLLIAAPAMSHNPKSKKMGQQSYLPFARSGKYGKLPTKKARPVRQKEAWIFRQWGR